MPNDKNMHMHKKLLINGMAYHHHVLTLTGYLLLDAS